MRTLNPTLPNKKTNTTRTNQSNQRSAIPNRNNTKGGTRPRHQSKRKDNPNGILLRVDARNKQRTTLRNARPRRRRYPTQGQLLRQGTNITRNPSVRHYIYRNRPNKRCLPTTPTRGTRRPLRNRRRPTHTHRRYPQQRKRMSTTIINLNPKRRRHPHRRRVSHTRPPRGPNRTSTPQPTMNNNRHRNNN